MNKKEAGVGPIFLKNAIKLALYWSYINWLDLKNTYQQLEKFHSSCSNYLQKFP